MPLHSADLAYLDLRTRDAIDFPALFPVSSHVSHCGHCGLPLGSSYCLNSDVGQPTVQASGHLMQCVCQSMASRQRGPGGALSAARRYKHGRAQKNCDNYTSVPLSQCALRVLCSLSPYCSSPVAFRRLTTESLVCLVSIDTHCRTFTTTERLFVVLGYNAWNAFQWYVACELSEVLLCS